MMSGEGAPRRMAKGDPRSTAGGSARAHCVRLLVAAWFGSLATTSSAQTPPPPPAQRPLAPTREEVTRPTIPPPAERKLEVEGGIPTAPCALGGPEFQSIHFVLSTVQFDGLEGLRPTDLVPAYSTYVGHDVPISTVCAIRDRASAILRDAGYIAAVQVPEQRIAGGVVHFRVLMAHLTQVRVRGDAAGAEAILAGYLNRLTRQPLFNRFEAERYLLLASDLPGYTVRLTLRPAGTAPGDVIGDVTVERMPAYVDFVVQNGGSHALGPWGGLLRAQLFGLTGLADRTSLSLYSTADLKEQQTVQLEHDMRLGDQGLGLSGSFAYAWAKPSIADARVLSRTLLASTELDYPFVRHQAETIRGSVGFDFINQTVEVDRAPFSQDRLRVAFARFGIDAAGTRFPDPGYSGANPPWHVFSLLEFRQGVDAFGATDCSAPDRCSLPTSRPAGHPDAAVVRWTFNSELRPAPKFTFALNLRAQYAWKPLLSFEQFAAGNYTVGRGYDPGALLGDRGWGSQIELRYGNRVPLSVKKAAVEGYTFWDHSGIHNLDNALSGAATRLDSVGGGAHIVWDRFIFDSGLAFPLSHAGPLNRKPGPRLLITLTTRLWPWQY
jgi:hemolysin activation/secretion protein